MKRIIIKNLNNLYKKRSNLLSDMMFGSLKVDSSGRDIIAIRNKHDNDEKIEKQISELNEKIKSNEDSLFYILKAEKEEK